MKIKIFFFTMLGFTMLQTAAMASGLSEIQEAQHKKAAMIPTLIVLFFLLGLAIAATKAALLYFTYRQQYGSKKALSKVLLNPKSILNTSTNSKQWKLAEQLHKALRTKKGQNLAFGLDTNILMYLSSDIFYLLKNETILVSRYVQQELDGLKNNADKETAANARRAFKALGDAQINDHHVQIVPGVDYKTLTRYNLADTKDDRIIASYLNVSAANPSAICFISHDNGAKITARNAGLTVLETSAPDRTKPDAQRKVIWGGGLVITILLLLFGSQLVSFIKANNEVSSAFSNPTESKVGIAKDAPNAALDVATRNPESIYFSEYQSEFEKATQSSDKLIAELIALPDKERADGTQQLRELLTTLMSKHYPNVRMDSLTDHQVQGTFYIGQGDVRFGLLCLDYYLNANDTKLQEIIAIDASDVGSHLFSQYTKVNSVKRDIGEIISYGLTAN
ncbi:PIN domain-containing protein [Cohnella terricola]|uniref:Phosphate starvation-inducible protein PhoH n=1 Tax=Cohnella terricola TaxID=1289167 RepID=A0A559JDK4_9BACL|nr:PIN domain-containing protein [Cohnella terricola]TVX97955.1 phosphate starvation-inducible protein PhoH [Cohnella terricola]